MTTCNINTMLFLIDSFLEMNKCLGISTNTIDIYKNQVNGMVKNDELSNKEKQLAYSILYIKETNSPVRVLEINTIKKIAFALQQIIEAGIDNKDTVISMLLNNGYIDKDIVKILNKIMEVWGYEVHN